MKAIVATLAAGALFAAIFVVAAYETLFIGRPSAAQEDDL